MRDLHNHIRVLTAIPPKAVGTSGAGNGSLSNVIDRRGYDAVEFAYSYGTTASAIDTITPVVLHSDSATAASFTSVADSDLLGTEAAAALTSGARASGTTMNVTKRLGYIGNKRYLRTRMYGLGTATGLVAAQVILSRPDRQPTAA